MVGHLMVAFEWGLFFAMAWCAQEGIIMGPNISHALGPANFVNATVDKNPWCGAFSKTFPYSSLFLVIYIMAHLVLTIDVRMH